MDIEIFQVKRIYIYIYTYKEDMMDMDVQCEPFLMI